MFSWIRYTQGLVGWGGSERVRAREEQTFQLRVPRSAGGWLSAHTGMCFSLVRERFSLPSVERQCSRCQRLFNISGKEAKFGARRVVSTQIKGSSDRRSFFFSSPVSRFKIG